MSKNQYPVLDNLFNSRLRVKVLKFLFRNYPVRIGIRDLSRRVQESYAAVSREMKVLEKIGLVRRG